ncbi:MAG: extensin family protein [Thalassovita mediterranea]|jgi:hypothetical protein|uniref:extensin-like domain-containing protein n=1 Tax=Thalassovita mediterranea TaxID=340021 RepID=UPI003C62A1E8
MRAVTAIFAGLWLALGGVGTVSADPLGRSLRPIERPQISSSVVVQNAARLVSPDLGQAILRDVAARVQVARVSDGLGRSLRPMARPDSRPSTLANKASRQPKRGSVCGDRSLRGEEVGRVPGKLRGCGVKNAIRLREVAGVTLSQPSVMECGTAKALKKWVENGLKPAVGRTGGGVSSLTIYGHYVCRTRNHRKGAKISEHGKGKAIDIGAIKLQNGQSLSVLKDWNKRREGRILKKAHRAACGPFGTVLGPDADKYHKDHFHFDTARHRSGSYCR